MVKWSHQANRDLRRIFDYIAQDSPHYARKVTQEIAAKTGVLNEPPRIGKMTPEVGDDDIRELSIYTVSSMRSRTMAPSRSWPSSTSAGP